MKLSASTLNATPVCCGTIGCALARLEQRQRRPPAIGGDLERTTLEPRRPELVRIDGFEPEMLRVPSCRFRTIGHTDVHMVEPTHSES